MTTAIADMTGMWQHFKGGYYCVDGEGTLTDVQADTPVVIYHPIGNDGVHDRSRSFVRSRADWFAMVEGPGGKVQRFTYVGRSVPGALTGDEAK